MADTIADPAIRAPFTRRFLLACEIYAELVDAACWQLLDDAGLLPAAPSRAEEIAAARSLPPRTHPALRFLLSKLADSGLLSLADGRYAALAPPAATVDALAAELESSEPDAAVGAEIVRTLVAEGPAFFRGEKAGEEILFSLERLPLWFRYFSNANILYSINNALGAAVLERVVPEGASILEVGGGCGSAAELALGALGPRAARYRFTELVPTFLRRGERAARAAATPGTVLESGKLDMTRAWGQQAIEAESVDVVYSVNCLHVAPDLGFVLGEARRALKPGGAVVVSECLRPTVAARPIYVEFVFSFLESFTNVKTDPLLRPTHGFLTPAAWKASFAAAGFCDVEVIPDVDAIAATYPNFVVGVVVARA